MEHQGNGVMRLTRWTQIGAFLLTLLVVSIGFIARLIRMEDKIEVIEKRIEDGISNLEGSQQAQDRRIERMDNNGTRKNSIIEDRQNAVIRRLDTMEQRMNQRWGQP